MNTTYDNVNLPCSNARQLGWASLYSRGLPPLPNLLFLSSAAKNLTARPFAALRVTS